MHKSIDLSMCACIIYVCMHVHIYGDKTHMYVCMYVVMFECICICILVCI